MNETYLSHRGIKQKGREEQEKDIYSGDHGSKSNGGGALNLNTHTLWSLEVFPVRSKSALLSTMLYIQDIQRIEIILLSDPRCNNEHLP